MKAMVLSGIERMEIKEVPDPVIGHDGDVRVRMGSIGICGSDVHYYSHGRIGDQVVQYPWIVGHECAGTVESVGSAVTRVKPGDRIAIDPAMPCWKCSQCRMGRHHTCLDLRFLACPGQAAGCLSEFIVLPETSCFPIEDNVSLDQAAVSEPLSVGLYAVEKSIPLKNATVGILGAGPIGLCVLLAAKAQKAGSIHITDKMDERLAVAKGAGASWTGNPDRGDVVDGILSLEPGGLDVVFECCGQQEALDQGIELLRPGGKLMIVGIPESARSSFNVDEMRRKEICIQNVRRQVDCVQQSLDLIGNGKIQVDFMITHRFDFDQTQEAFELVAGYGDGVVKAIVNLHGCE
ncbi:MAG: alcohol dehydrogenase catalytic domain-containing protein [Proteobacteria bacterium]|nr:alcohol dehydrogenase catalytic domain-containing protein [Pseudomonadota bacterium]